MQVPRVAHSKSLSFTLQNQTKLSYPLEPCLLDYLIISFTIIQLVQFFIQSFFPLLLSSFIYKIRCLIMCSKCRLLFSNRLCFVNKQEIDFFPCADIVSYFLLLLLVCDWPSKRWHLKCICRDSRCPKYQVNHGL